MQLPDHITLEVLILAIESKTPRQLIDSRLCDFVNPCRTQFNKSRATSQLLRATAAADTMLGFQEHDAETSLMDIVCCHATGEPTTNNDDIDFFSIRRLAGSDFLNSSDLCKASNTHDCFDLELGF